MPAGIPGEPNRGWANIIEPIGVTPQGTTGAPTAYGVPVIVDQTGGNVGNARTIATGDTNATVYGILVRPYPTQSPVWSPDPAIGAAVPPPVGAVDVMRSGYVSILLSGSSAAVKGMPVYIWKSAATGTHIQGGFESTDPTTDGFVLVGAQFMGPADANGNTEIAYNV
jgi:hypothetical protein